MDPSATMSGCLEMMEKPPSKDQKRHWTEVYAQTPAFFGEEPSGFARWALERLRAEGVGTVLELGFGQGRDTLFFAENGLRVTALDYSEQAVREVEQAGRVRQLSERIEAGVHDVRDPLPFPDSAFDACYAHMLLCMELTEAEIAFALAEIHRVVKPGGLVLYTVRSDHDKHYRAGTPLREDIYEVGGFVVHFFTEEKIRRLARGYDLEAIGRMEEGRLPRDLYVVTLRRRPGPMPDQPEVTTVGNPMKKFDGFFDAVREDPALEPKTRGLLFLAASLAVGCEL